MSDAIIVREWDAEAFHRQVLELESGGYKTRRETYQIIAEMNPETGRVIHLYTVEMYKPGSDEPGNKNAEARSGRAGHYD